MQQSRKGLPDQALPLLRDLGHAERLVNFLLVKFQCNSDRDLFLESVNCNVADGIDIEILSEKSVLITKDEIVSAELWGKCFAAGFHAIFGPWTKNWHETKDLQSQFVQPLARSGSYVKTFWGDDVSIICSERGKESNRAVHEMNGPQSDQSDGRKSSQ